MMAATIDQLAADISALLGRRTLSLQEHQDWLAGTATGGPDGNGTYPLTDSTGLVRKLPSPAKMQALSSRDRCGVVYTDDFDPAAGAGSAHDDALALQSMFNAQYLSPYPRPALRPRARYYSSATIVVDPSRNTLDGNNAQIGWDLKQFTDPASLPNLVTSDPEFLTGDGWIKSNNDKSTAESLKYDGALRVTQPVDQHLYYERGQQLIVPAGQLMTIKIRMLSITKNTVGVNTYHDIIFSLRNPGTGSAASAIGGGANVGTNYTLDDRDSDYEPGKTYTWTVTSSVANPYLRIQSDASFELDSIVAQIVPNNTCLLVQVPSGGYGGTLRGHNQREFRNFKLSGRFNQSSYVDAVLFHTPKWPTINNVADLGQHSRVNWYNFDISDGINRGLVFHDRTYLSNFHGFRIVCTIYVDTVTNTFDSGENISFVAGNMGGGSIAIRNLGGHEIRLIKTSLDFCTQWFVGKAVTMYGGWLENNASSGKDDFKGTMLAGSDTITDSPNWTPGNPLGATITGPGIPEGTTVLSRTQTRVTPTELWSFKLSAANTNTATVTGEVFAYNHLTTTNRPLIDVSAGERISLRNTLIQQDGNTSTQLEAPFRVAAGGLLDIEASPAYNLDGRASCLCVGDGRFIFKQIGTGVNRNVEPINKRDDNHNVIGASGRFEGSSIDIPAFLATTGSGQRRLDRNTIVMSTAGSFTGTLSRGSTIVTGLTSSPNSGFAGREITGGLAPEGTVVTDYQIEGTTFTGTATVGSNVITGVTPQPTSGTAYRRFVSGSGIPRGARILSYTGNSITLDKEINSGGAITVTTPNLLELSAPALVSLAAGSIPFRTTSTDSAIMRVTSAFTAYEGTRCLEIYKDLPDNEPLMACIGVPCQPNRAYGSEIRWAVPAVDSFSDSKTGSIFFQPFFRRVIDAEGTNPRLTPQNLILTDYPKTNIPMKTGTNGWVDRAPHAGQSGMWRQMGISLNSPGLGFHDGFVPEWATHLVWQVSLVSFPRGGSLLIDGLIGNNQ